MKQTKINKIIAYPTYLLTHQWEDYEELNDELCSIILEKEKTTQGITKSNSGGYHSEYDLLKWKGEAIQKFTNMITFVAEEELKLADINKQVNLSITAWANVMRSGNYHVVHKHPNNTWSGSYYVRSGNADKSIKNNGLLELVDPRTGNNMIIHNDMPSQQYQIPPKEGLMCMFPSYLDHFVHTYIGTEERISIAFNIRII